jgi:DNA-binding NtrC family response regulator
MNKKRILVVDDDAAIRETLERSIARWGYDVVTAASAEDALANVARLDPAIVVTDVRMGGMDGLELLRTLRERAPSIDVIVITAFEEMRTAIDAMKAGAFEYLVKPLDLDHIELVLHRCFTYRALRRRANHLAAVAGEPFALEQIAGRDPRMIEIYKTIGQVARSRAPVLIRGETGTGKELIARAIHFNSADLDEPFVAVNCTAIPEPLLESELFGHKRGAFTGAVSDRRGSFAQAAAGTVFLDEIGDTSGAFQAKLLRVLQDREFTPIGAERGERTDARVIAATHRDLETLVHDRVFREDLYFRLRVVELRVPPLRERRADIPILVEHFLKKLARTLNQPPRVLTREALSVLTAHDWPGNVRELENALTRAAVLSRGDVIDAADVAISESVPHSETAPPEVGDALALAEAAHVRRVLAKAGGNKRKAARLLRVSRTRLDRLIERHNLRGDDGIESKPTKRTDGRASSPRPS